MSTQKSKPAVQLVLGSQAITFPLPIAVKSLDGSEATVTFTCRALRKSAWAKAKDAHHQAALKVAAGKAEERPTNSEELITYLDTNGVHSVVTQGLQTDAALILQFATDWDLADAFGPEKLQELEDEFGGTFRKVLEAYDTAIFQGRLGN